MDATNAPAFRTEILRRIESGRPRLVVDLSAIEFMDSAGLSVLVAAGQRIGARGTFAIVGVKGAVARLLALTGVERILSLHATTDDALDLMAA